MRIQVDPQRVEVADNQPFTVSITVTNTGTVIGGYRLRVLGADPAWVTMEAENLSLFPDTSQTVAATIAIPPGVGAGDRRIAVQVRELTPPQAVAVAEIELVVPAREAMRMALSPLTVVCGKHGRFSVVAENTGNTPISMAPIGMDPEDKIRFEFVPAVLDLAPGEHVITDLRTTAKRRWFGSPVVRPFSLAAVPPQDLRPATAAAPPAPGEVAVAEPPPPPPEPLAQGTIMQKPKVGRGALSLISLLLAVSVFAVVITIAMSRLVGVSAADRDLALQVAEARGGGGGSGSSELGGTVKLLTDGSPARGVTVEVFASGDLTQPIISTATNDNGKWAVSAMPAGSYKVRFRGAGFAEVWYPNALTGADAKEVQLDAGQSVTGLEVALGGLPASISGQVMGADVAGAILTVQVPQEYLKTVTKSAAPQAAANPGTVTAQPVPGTDQADAGSDGSPPGLRQPGAAQVAAPPSGGGSDGAPPTTAGAEPTGGVLRTVPIGSDGMFTLSDLPSPAVYTLIVSKTGYATTWQRVDLSGGESRSGITLVLRTGDGLIAGTINGPDGHLGNAVITATSGDRTVRTLSLTSGKVGSFTLRNLVTPGTYSITVTKSGYATQTSTLSLTSGQRLTGVLFTLSKSSGALSGVATTLADGKPASGVTVTVTSGSSGKLSTVTQSGSGSWTIANLPIPDTYTVTFSRPDLESQTVSAALNSAGTLTSGAGASGGIDVAMKSAYATVSGTVRQQSGTSTVPVGEATISLTSGTQSYTVTSASNTTTTVSGHKVTLGNYEIAHVVPGTYTLSASTRGTSPTTVIVTVTAGQAFSYDPILIQPASISGKVDRAGKGLGAVEVDLYLSTDYPGKVYAQTTTDQDGNYRFSGVDAPQAYVVEARSATTGPLASGTIVLPASKAGTLNLHASVDTSSAPPAPTAPSSPASTTGSSTTSTSPSSAPTTPAASDSSTTPPNSSNDSTAAAGTTDTATGAAASTTTTPPAGGDTGDDSGAGAADDSGAGTGGSDS